jgi:hypothetical protein
MVILLSSARIGISSRSSALSRVQSMPVGAAPRRFHRHQFDPAPPPASSPSTTSAARRSSGLNNSGMPAPVKSPRGIGNSDQAICFNPGLHPSLAARCEITVGCHRPTASIFLRRSSLLAIKVTEWHRGANRPPKFSRRHEIAVNGSNRQEIGRWDCTFDDNCGYPKTEICMRSFAC